MIPLIADLRHHNCNEMRRKMRFPLRLPCRYWWVGEDGGLLFGAGTTVDFSSDSVRVASSAVPPAAALITVEADLPKLREPTPREMLEEIRLHGEGSAPLMGEGRVIWQNSETQEFAAQVCFSPLLSARPTRSLAPSGVLDGEIL